MKSERCSECGAELRLRPASCPLCGAAGWPAPPEPEAVSDDDYQSNIRKLREELKRLRADEAEAV